MISYRSKTDINLAKNEGKEYLSKRLSKRYIYFWEAKKKEKNPMIDCPRGYRDINVNDKRPQFSGS